MNLARRQLDTILLLHGLLSFSKKVLVAGIEDIIFLIGQESVFGLALFQLQALNLVKKLLLRRLVRGLDHRSLSRGGFVNARDRRLLVELGEDHRRAGLALDAFLPRSRLNGLGWGRRRSGHVFLGRLSRRVTNRN